MSLCDQLLVRYASDQCAQAVSPGTIPCINYSVIGPHPGRKRCLEWFFDIPGGTVPSRVQTTFRMAGSPEVPEGRIEAARVGDGGG